MCSSDLTASFQYEAVYLNQSVNLKLSLAKVRLLKFLLFDKFLPNSFQYEVGEYKTSQLQDKESYAVRNKVNTFATDASGSGQATYNLPYGNIYTTGTNSIRAYNFRQQLDFNKTFAEKHDVTALFGMEVRENKTEYNNRKYYNYDPALLTYDLIDERVLSNTYTGVLGNYVSFNKNDISNIYELVNRFVSFYGNAA